MKPLALGAIRLYQRYISPYKGFICAYRAHTGRASCSALGYRAVRRYGVFRGAGIIGSRTHLCGVAHRRYQATPLPRALHSQRGDCDPGCDLPCDGGCDLPSGISRGIADCLSSCDFGGDCDWPRKRKESKEKEQHIHIPPERKP
ncbi:hypothetical protein BWI17_15450 [Betaproteobacteria bacterium GR16-43]|nr:hypothetical protein BWI17_15450 [Betaproteobacteria bacterium GR16-43]